jgi:hypothetical protein
LCDAEEPLKRVYFVEAGIVSLVTVFEDGTMPEMATVGREGMVCIGALLGGEHPLGRYVVLVPGFALAMEASEFQGSLRETPELRAACEAYAQAFVSHLLLNVACNAAHSVEQWCARWLLMCADRTEDETVKPVAGTLQQAGLIRHHGDAITVCERRGLETAACECYRIVRDRCERLLARAFD